MAEAGLAENCACDAVYSRQGRAHRAVNDIRDAKAMIAALHKEAGRTGDAHIRRRDWKSATAIEEQLMQVKIKSTEGNLNYPTC